MSAAAKYDVMLFHRTRVTGMPTSPSPLEVAPRMRRLELCGLASGQLWRVAIERILLSTLTGMFTSFNNL